MLAKKRRIVLRFVCITTLEGYGCAADKEIVQQVFIPKDALPGPFSDANVHVFVLLA